MKQAMEITGRTRRTIERWVKDGLLEAHDVTVGRRTHTEFHEGELLAVESERACAALENHERIRRKRGRPRRAEGDA